MNKLMMLAAALVIGGVLIFATTYKFGMLEELVNQMESAPAEPEVVEVIPPSYVEMDTLVVPVLKDGVIKNRVDVTVQLEVAQDDVSYVKQQMPIIRDTLLRDLHDFLPKHLNNRSTPDLFALKARLKKASAKVAGGKISDVVIKGAFNR